MKKKKLTGKRIDKLVDEIVETYHGDSGINFIDAAHLPVRGEILEITELLFEVLFPGHTGNRTVTKANIRFIVGDILWSWWWEYNKDRFLARATERGRVNAGSTLYWFGSGAKYPPRDITPVSDTQKRQIFVVLKKRLQDKSLAVRKAACIALGRLGVVLEHVGTTQIGQGVVGTKVCLGRQWLPYPDIID